MARKKLKEVVVYQSLQQALDEFIFLKKGEQLRERTINDYVSHVTRFYVAFPKHGTTLIISGDMY
ncbi:hypothetical protein H1S01_18085 [Heliobacterium chlorum]|uniref:Integrase SAM-like N-terminal domain-containing protein n=1 Tax=Heliobacterium chlorum TaxID=2698 RepID=A0ABR7T8L2_HELCL|nr:hypothetical protein [Heliobacterium chlorum]MBC9786370.1 hypothetical protein [Heliobacterium chlorum]